MGKAAHLGLSYLSKESLHVMVSKQKIIGTDDWSK